MDHSKNVKGVVFQCDICRRTFFEGGNSSFNHLRTFQIHWQNICSMCIKLLGFWLYPHEEIRFKSGREFMDCHHKKISIELVLEKLGKLTWNNPIEYCNQCHRRHGLTTNHRS